MKTIIPLILSFICFLLIYSSYEAKESKPVKTSFSDHIINYEFIPKYDKLPMPSNVSDAETEAAWNKFTIDTFSIHSIDIDIGKKLSSDIESFKKESLNSWGIDDFKFEQETRIFICPTEDILNKLFNIKNSAFEYRQDKKILYIWMVLNESNYNSFKSVSMSMCLIHLENKFNYKFPLWIHRGMPLLSISLDKTKETIKIISDLRQIQTVKYVSNLKDIEYKQLEDKYKKQYDATAAILCLFVRKEFGQDKFHFAMMENVVLYKLLGYTTPEEFDSKFTYFCTYLLDDFVKNRINSNYLLIKPKKL